MKTKENAEALLITSVEVGLEVNVENEKNMLMPHEHNAWKNHNIKEEIKNPLKP